MGNYLIEIRAREGGYVTQKARGGTYIESSTLHEALGALAALMNLDVHHRVAKCQVRLEGLASDPSFLKATAAIVNHHNSMVDIQRHVIEPIPPIVA
jgi:hypothetical protein